MLGNLSIDIICSSKLTVLCSWKTVCFSRNGGHCLCIFGVAYDGTSANMNEWPSVVEITPIKTLGHAFRKLKADQPSKDQLNGILQKVSCRTCQLPTLERVKQVGSLGGLNTSLKRMAMSAPR